MIEITRLNGTKYFVNPDMIEFMESTPDTVITLSTEKKLVVLESPAELLDRIIQYRRAVYSNLPRQLDRSDLDYLKKEE